MKIVIQRVKEAKLYIENEFKGKIGRGLVIFVGVKKGDDEEKIDYFIKKILSLRIFEDEDGKMNYSVSDINGEIMIISQFTLYGDCVKGNRPDFTNAEKKENAKKIFEKFVEKIKKSYEKIIIGDFGKKNLVEIHNDGPCTLILEK
ncbi:MAG: D-aminoacyl-tRNA deacylase [Candidatus Ratteibacteria bacterium]